MKRINFRKTLGAVVLIGGTIMAASATADQPQGAYGHGMMGGYGPGYGQGQGYNMGPGMMGGYGPGYGMGPGMMGGYGPGYDRGADLNLTADQRGKIAKIQGDARRKQWNLMGKMQDEQSQMNEQYYSANRDDAALSKSYRKMSDLRHQIFDLSLSTQKQIDAVLTKEQREKQKRG